MSSIALEQIVLKNFRSFRDETIDFPSRGLICIRGLNRDTGGSSGAGKSSLLLGLAYAFGYSHLDGTTLKTWGSDGNMKVQVRFRTGQGRVVTVSRGAKFELSVDGKPVTGSASNKEQELQKLLGVVPKMLGTLTYRAQKKPSLFLSMTDSEKKKFLSEVLGLDRFERIAKQTSETANRLAIELDPLEKQIEVARLAIPAEKPTLFLQSLDEWHAKLVAAETKINQLKEKHSLVLGEERKLTGLIDTELVKLEADYKAKLAALETPKSDKLTSLISKLSILRGGKEKYVALHKDRQVEASMRYRATSETISRLQLAVSAKESLAAQLAKVDAQLLSLKSKQCPTCNRSWGQTNEAVSQMETDRDALLRKLDSIAGLELEIVAKQPEIKARQDEINSLMAIDPIPENVKAMEKTLVEAIAREEQALATIDQTIRDAKKSLEIEYHHQVVLLKSSELAVKRTKLLEQSAQLSRDIDATEQQIASTTALLRQLERANDTARKSHAQACAMYDAAVNGYEDAKAKVQTQINELAAQRELARLFGREGFLGAIFDEILDEITEEVNSTLISLPNVSHITLRFESTRETQEGNLKKEIRPVIYLAGNVVPAEALSGGQYTAVELAVDRAVASVLGRRSGVQPGWLVLDEAFDGFDDVVKENSLEILRAVAQDNLVMVVDHSESFKAMFDNSITLEYRDGETRVIK